ncbi:hypothetical protein [Nocardia sp. NPDC004860]|uniref:hypothetical protein n=1 Tax=Nocardia sp. NPDC004860 TaxID=3154557 RepID=UPI0033ABD0E7
MGDELSAFGSRRDAGASRKRPISLGGRIDNLGTYRFLCPTVGCRWFRDENTTQSNPRWRELVEAAIDDHLAARHPHWIHPEYN